MDYEIGRRSRVCCISGRPFAPGEALYSALIDAPEGLVRKDFAVEHWTGPPPDAIGYWRGRLPEETGSAKPKPVSKSAMLELFAQWEKSTDPNAIRMRYVLSLLLIRRKALKLHGVERDDAGEWLLVGPPRSAAIERLADPRLSDEAIEAVERQLTSLLETAENDLK